MTYSRAVLLTLALVMVASGACASSRPEGTGIDAADTTDPDAADTIDPDAADTTDGAAIDSSAIDATAIDAVPNDGTLPIDAPTDANTCPTAPCDLYAQCGCTSPLVCDLDFTDLVGNSCRAVNMAGTETSSCVQGGTPSPSYCAGGYVCLGGATDASCERYCDASSDCGQPRGQCVIQVTNNNVPIPNVQVCSSNCNPLNSAAGPCPPGQGKCGFFTVNNALTGNVARDVVQCTAPGAGAHGAACTNDTTCSADTLCTTVNALSRCRRVCNRTTGGSECASVAGTTCIGFNPALTIGGTEYGVCAP